MGNVIWILPLLVWGKPFIYHFVFIFAKKKNKIKKVNKLYFQIKSKFSRRQLAVWVPLSESYVNQSSRRSKTWRSAERRLMQTPIDWLTYWHKLAADWLKDWMTGRLAAWLMVVSSQLKWKSRTVSMSIQAIYQSCLEINQPKPSQATQSVQSVSHSMSRPCSASDSSTDSDSDSDTDFDSDTESSDTGSFCLRNAFLTFYWLKRQHWRKYTHSAGRKCKYLTTFFFSRCSFIFIFFSVHKQCLLLVFSSTNPPGFWVCKHGAFI